MVTTPAPPPPTAAIAAIAAAAKRHIDGVDAAGNYCDDFYPDDHIANAYAAIDAAAAAGDSDGIVTIAYELSKAAFAGAGPPLNPAGLPHVAIAAADAAAAIEIACKEAAG